MTSHQESKSAHSDPNFQHVKSSEPAVIENIYSARHDTGPHEIKKRYIILSTQRTGSTYLTRRLHNLQDSYGLPAEYFNPRSFKILASRLIRNQESGEGRDKPISLEMYLRAIEKVRTSKDGYFGIKIQPWQLDKVYWNFKQKNDFKLKFIENFDYIILMSRRDKLAQAISCSISELTDQWHDIDDHLVLNDDQIHIAYRLIVKNIERLFSEEEFILSVKDKIKKPILHLQYEQIESNPNAIFESVVRFLADDRAIKIPQEERNVPVPNKSSNKLQHMLRSNFIEFISGRLGSQFKTSSKC